MGRLCEYFLPDDSRRACTLKRRMVAWQLTCVFPVDMTIKTYYENMIEKFDNLTEEKHYSWKIGDILPEVLIAGEHAGTLTEEGAKLLDPSGELNAGIPFCPPEGDAGTGMTATNSVAKRTGNVSAGTSVFAMVVLEKELSKVYEEIDLVTTPTGDLTAMVHCNNCTSDLNAWVALFKEFVRRFKVEVDMTKLFGDFTKKALEGDPDCGGLLVTITSRESISQVWKKAVLTCPYTGEQVQSGELHESPPVHIAWRAEDRNGHSFEKRGRTSGSDPWTRRFV